MSVRYKPRGVDMRPGRRVCYKFENEVTREKGIPARYTYGTILGVHQGHARVAFEDTEPPYLPVASIPIPCLAPDDDPDNPVGYGNLSYQEWWDKHRIKSTAELWEERFPRGPNVVERAEARFGPSAYWKRATRNWYRRNGIPLPR